MTSDKKTQRKEIYIDIFLEKIDSRLYIFSYIIIIIFYKIIKKLQINSFYIVTKFNFIFLVKFLLLLKI